MNQLVDAMNEDSNDEDEMEELSRDLRVRFVPPKAQSKKAKSKKTDSAADLRQALAASGSPPSEREIISKSAHNYGLSK